MPTSPAYALQGDEDPMPNPMIQLMEARGQCAGVTGTPSPWEMQRRWEEADKEVRFHMEIPQPEPPK